MASAVSHILPCGECEARETARCRTIQIEELEREIKRGWEEDERKMRLNGRGYAGTTVDLFLELVDWMPVNSDDRRPM